VKSGILFGECKTYGTVEEKDLKRMRTLAKEFPGACLAFCTLRKTITAKEVRALKRLAKVGRRY
jgi:hypothetical protein